MTATADATAAASVILTTSLSSVDGARGVLVLRGWRLEELLDARARWSDVAAMLLLPPDERRPVLDPMAGDAFEHALARCPPNDAVHPLSAQGVTPMARIRLALDALAHDVGDDLHRVVATVSSTVCALASTSRGEPAASIALPGASTAARVLAAVRGREPDAALVAALDAAFVMHIDHALNPGTLAARVAASTGANLAASAVAGCAALEGPLHGGASTDVGRMLAEIGHPDRVDAWLAQRRARGGRVPGFGHPIYRVADPRARALRALAAHAADVVGDHGIVDVAVRLEERVRAEQARDGRALHPNVDFYAAALYATLGVPLQLHTPLFAVARVVGWCAHAREQRARGRILSPEAGYDGPAPTTP